jgi:hypothetical protein
LAGRVAAGLGVLAGAVVLFSGWGLVRALLGPSAGAQVAAKEDKAQAEKLKGSFDAWTAQTEGRSLFLVPGPKVAVVEKPPEVPTATAETTLADWRGQTRARVWFDDGKIIAAGGEKDGDVRVVSLDAPWSAKIEWKGVEFSVPFFAHDTVVFPPAEAPKPPAPPAEPAPSAEPAATPPPSAPTPSSSTPDQPAGPAPAPAKDTP